jgi:sulfur-oxidizing protein SoxZ
MSKDKRGLGDVEFAGKIKTQTFKESQQENLMADPMKIRAQMAGNNATVRVLMAHEMETGLRKDASGALVAAHYITDVLVLSEGRAVLEARMSQAVSQDPLLSFRFRGGRQGDRITVRWTDSRGEQRSDEVLVT